MNAMPACDTSRNGKNKAVSTLSFPVENAPRVRARHRKRAERTRNRDAGLVSVSVQVAPENRWIVHTVAALLRHGGMLAGRMVRVARILEDKLPERRRARMQAPKISRDEARMAQVVVLRDVRRRDAA